MSVLPPPRKVSRNHPQEGTEKIFLSTSWEPGTVPTTDLLSPHHPREPQRGQGTNQRNTAKEEGLGPPVQAWLSPSPDPLTYRALWEPAMKPIHKLINLAQAAKGPGHATRQSQTEVTLLHPGPSVYGDTRKPRKDKAWKQSDKNQRCQHQGQ